MSFSGRFELAPQKRLAGTILYSFVLKNTSWFGSDTIDCMISDEYGQQPFYFRGIKNNFLGSKDNLILLLIMTSFVIFTIVIMYMQVLKGPRFMLSINLNQSQSEYNFYKSKEELNLIRNSIGTEECVICLLPIFEEDNGDDNADDDES